MKRLEQGLWAFIVLVYFSGAVGMMWAPFRFIPYTPWVLLLFLIYFLAVHFKFRRKLFFTWAIMGLLCFVIEALGVNLSWFFGSYYYGRAFGPGLWGVPFCIGINWVLMISCSWGWLNQFNLSRGLQSLATAALCTGMDFLMEPLAPHFDWWVFKNGWAGPYNYITWFVVSGLLGGMFSNSLRHVNSAKSKQWLLLNGLYFMVLLVNCYLL